jgi:GTPase SAR1 family protein
VGKTTLFEVLKDPNYHTPSTYSFFASGPKEPQYHPLLVRNQSGRAYSINVIDTPGLSEVRTSLHERRSNDQIVRIIQDCVTSSVCFWTLFDLI